MLDFIATNFAANLSDTYSISIRQLPGGYNFYITNNKNEGVAIKYLPTQHASPTLLANEPLLQLKYRSASYIGHGPFALIPQNLVINNNYTIFLPIEKNLQLRTKTIINPINPDTVITCYSNQWITPQFKCSKHHEIELLAFIAQQQAETNLVSAEINNTHINIVIIKNNKIHLANSYNISCENDAAYYILACYQQLNLSQEDTKLNILGNITSLNPIPILKDYIRQINILKPNNWNPEFNNDYASLFTLQTFSNLLCE